jgi:hypothetical protein
MEEVPFNINKLVAYTMVPKGLRDLPKMQIPSVDQIYSQVA